MKESVPDIPVIAGRFFFSSSRRRLNDKTNKSRLFMKCIATERILEYTEVITMADVVENPKVGPVDSDAVFVGEGFYHHRSSR